MSTERDVTRIVRSWMREDEHESADRVLDAVLDQLDTTPQRRAGWPAWRTPIMNKFVAIGLGAAAVVVALLVGAQLLAPGTGTGGPGDDSTPTPMPTVEPAPQGGLEPGTQWILSEHPEIGPISVTVPGPGWDGEGDGGVIFPMSEDNSGILVFYGDLWIYGDPCAWSTTTPEAPATTVDEIIAALAAQASRDASTPEDITIGGYAGQRITLHVPDAIAFDPATDAGFPDCDRTYFGTLEDANVDEPPPHRYHQGPGQIDEFWVMDVDGVPVVIDLTYFPDAPQQVIDDFHAMAESATFGE
jgi:hypothetical protein